MQNLRADRQQGGNNAASPAREEFGASAISLPKGGGAIRGIGEKSGVNPVTGTGSLILPFPATPGRSGLRPEPSLAHDVVAGNGPFGFGWHLSLPEIARKTDKGLPLYRDAQETDVYILSGAEDLVPVLGPDKTKLGDEQRAPLRRKEMSHEGNLRSHP